MNILFLALISAHFSELNIQNGQYDWLRLNTRGHEYTRCLSGPDQYEDLVKEPTELSGSIEFLDDKMISTRSKGECKIKETVRLLGLDGNIATLKLEDISTSGCVKIDDVRRVNVERPYDDENLTFVSAPFKMVEMIRANDFIEFGRGDRRCFYAKKK